MGKPLVSILLCNNNYERFLSMAIESALDQAYSRTEVVVVDDGSTDRSREVIAGYGDRIAAVFKEHGGLASSVNAGLRRCHGELVALLDSDDVFMPTKVERVIALAEREPDACLYYHRLRTMDAEGHPRGRPWPRDVWSGDIGHRVRAAGGWWPRPTTSAMVFRRSFLERIGPLPEDDASGRMRWPDAFAGDLAPFLGRIQGLPQTLAQYRLHGDNRGALEPARRIQQYAFEVEQLMETLRVLGKPVPPLRLDRHLGIARERARLRGGPALVRAVWLALGCPTLGLRGRLAEASRALLDALVPRGASGLRPR